MVEKGKTYLFKFTAEAGKEYLISCIDSDGKEKSIADTEIKILKADLKTQVHGTFADMNKLGNSYQKGQKIQLTKSMEVYIKIEGKSDGTGMVTVAPM